MKTLTKLICSLLLITILSQTNSVKAQTINTDAIDEYWKLTAILKQNIAITDKQWTDFINIDGNKTYAESEFTPEMLTWYRRALEIVYMPKNDSVLKKNLKANNWYCILAKRYKDHEKEIKDAVKTIQNPAYFNQAYQYVYEYLPKKAQHPVPNLKLYYNCLSNDAVSYPNGLFFSMLAVTSNWNAKVGTLEAHELHHRLRPTLGIDTLMPADEGIVWAITSIQNEGMADMIDKVWELKESGDPEGITDWLLTPAPATIKSLDSCINVLATNKAAGVQNERYYRNLLKRTVGHMPGFYMTRIIVGNGYKKQMINKCYDPFEFIYLYNKAAKKDINHPVVFSDKSITYLKELQKKYKAKIVY